MIKFYKTLSFTLPAIAADNQPVQLVPDLGNYFGILAPEFLVQGNSDLLTGLGLESNAVLSSYRLSFPGAVGLRPGSGAMAAGNNQIQISIPGRDPGLVSLFWIDQEPQPLDLDIIRAQFSLGQEHAPQVVYNLPADPITLFVDTRNLQPLYLGAAAFCLIELTFTNRIMA